MVTVSVVVMLARGAHDPFRRAKRVRGHPPPTQFVREPLTCENSTGETPERVQRTPLRHLCQCPPSAPLGYALGYGGTRRPLRVNPKRPVTCTNVVGDTGIEPVTSSVSVIGTTSADIRWRPSVQVMPGVRLPAEVESAKVVYR